MATIETVTSTYRLTKESFVSNLDGSSTIKVIAHCFLPCSATWLWINTGQGDLLCHLVIPLLGMTLCADYIYGLNFACLIGGTLAWLLSTRTVRQERKQAEHGTYLAFLTIYRGSMMLMTCLAILAVDFTIFPRELAKVETKGLSFMDTGVGSFVFSAGFISSSSTKSFRQSWPILLLGLARTILTKLADYPEHISEYGKHWNFFFTLAFVPLVQGPVSRLVDETEIETMVWALGAGLIWETSLSLLGLEHWALYGDRSRFGWISQNKEGLVSFPGYCIIYLLALDLARHLPKGKDDDREAKKKDLVRDCAQRFVLYAAAFMAMQIIGYPLSRRSANLSYVLFIAALNSGTLLTCLLIELAAGPKQQSWTLTTFNRGGLVTFLLANVSTGLINLSTETIYWDRMPAFGLLLGYGLGLTSMTWYYLGMRKRR